MTTPTWFITGASSGFGLAFTQYALARGYNVVATARNLAKLEQIEAPSSSQLLIHKLDVTAAGDAERAVASALKRFGRVDVLINNAGYGIVGALEETSDSELRAQMETNFFGAINVTKAVLPTMRTQRAGAIVNISSLGGQLSFGGFSAYSVSYTHLDVYKRQAMSTATRGALIRNTPVISPRRAARLSVALSMSSNAGSILARNLAPASVNRTLRVVRANSGSPSRSSTALTAWLTADGLMFNDAAAAANPPNLATLTTTGRCDRISRSIRCV